MQINIKDSPEEAVFESDFPYLVYGKGDQMRFVFDDNGESFFLYELTFEKVEDTITIS